MRPIDHIQNALADLNAEVEQLLRDTSRSMTQKDAAMLSLLREQKVLKQTLEDLRYLQDHPVPANQPCGISKYRED
ncbi:MAG: hypothetical protein JXK05_10460 [Campylobacterales bacterium]|nr:hypothetical protein [Campylobacterales bacterium]